MIVTRYDIHFTKLLCYIPYLVLTKRIRINRFIKELMKPLYIVIVPQMIKIKEIEIHASQEKTKKTKIQKCF